MILYVFAMEDEAKDVLKSFNEISGEGFPIYKNNNELLVITGIGKANAALITSYVLGKFNISKIVNLGFVGAVGDFTIGEKLIVKNARYHDVDVTMFGYEKGQIPKMPAYYETSSEMLKKFNNLKQANIYTGDYFMVDKIEDNYIADMEVTSLFQVAYRLNVPIVSFKVVSDIIGSDNHLDEYKDFEVLGSKIINELYKEISEVI